MALIRYIIAAAALAGMVAGCESDPYMKRPGGYTPGSYAWTGDRSANYASQSDYYRHYRAFTRHRRCSQLFS